MKKSIAVMFAVSTILLAGCCTTPHATKWEYKVAFDPRPAAGSGPEERRALEQKFLNDLGKDGWVLVSGGGQEGNWFYFRRPVK
jgi:hypothetical protein